MKKWIFLDLFRMNISIIARSHSKASSMNRLMWLLLLFQRVAIGNDIDDGHTIWFSSKFKNYVLQQNNHINRNNFHHVAAMLYWHMEIFNYIINA